MNEGAEAPPTKEDMQMFFVSGIGQKKDLNPAAICGGVDKVGKVETELSFIDGLIGLVSSGIVTPRTARVYCLK